jgi:hypothetical protein
MAFLGYPRGNRIDPETRCSMQHTVPNERMDTLPRTRASQNRWPSTRYENLGEQLSSVQRSSGLRLQLLGIKTFLLFPKCQSNGRDLPC